MLRLGALAMGGSWRLVVTLAITVLLLPGVVQADDVEYAIPNGYFYKQANGQGGAGTTGFSVTDDGSVPFWSEFQRLGGVEVLGYPISRRFVWDGFTVQAFQKVVLQWQPGRGVFFVNVFDRMSQGGKDVWLESARVTPPNFDHSADGGLSWDDVVKRHLALLDVNPAIKEKYLADSDPIQHYGLPMSSKDYGNVFVVRAQRAVLQQWQTDVPWAKAGQVVVANGGDIAKEAGMFPAQATAPEASGASSAPVAQVSDRDALAQFANKILELDRQMATAIRRFNDVFKRDRVKATDTFVKDVEGLLPQIDAAVAPDVPFARAFLDRYRAGAKLYYEGMQKATWALADPKAPADTMKNALAQLEQGDKDMEQAFWEFKAAVEKQGLRYNSQKGAFE